MTRAIFNLRHKSLVRANTVVLGSVGASILLSHFPHVRPDLWIIIPAMLAMLGTVDTLRNIDRRWSLYHAGVILCVYMDLMAVSLVLFFLFYPFLNLGARNI